MTVAVYLKSKKLWENGSLENAILQLAQTNKNVRFILLSPFLLQKQLQKDGVTFLKVPSLFASNTFSKFAFQFLLRRIAKKHDVTHFITEELFDLPKLKINYYWYASSVHYNEAFFKPDNISRLNSICSHMQAIAVTDELMHSLLANLQLKSLLPIIQVGLPMLATQQVTELDSDAENPYFFCKANWLTLSEITIILKAFSIFKKRTKSGATLQLIIDANEQAAFRKKLASYKFRDGVVVKADNKITKSESHNLLACICMDVFPHVPYVLEKLQAGLSVILRDGKYKLLFKDAALYASLNEKDLADAMILLYNNEQISKAIKINATELVQWHQIENTSNNLWQLLKVSGVDGPM